MNKKTWFLEEKPFYWARMWKTEWGDVQIWSYEIDHQSLKQFNGWHMWRFNRLSSWMGWTCHSKGSPIKEWGTLCRTTRNRIQSRIDWNKSYFKAYFWNIPQHFLYQTIEFEIHILWRPEYRLHSRYILSLPKLAVMVPKVIVKNSTNGILISNLGYLPSITRDAYCTRASPLMAIFGKPRFL